MKRSEINKALRELEAMCRQEHCYLPSFCNFTPEQWQSVGHEYDEVRDCMLGWDITDYGLGDFDKVGFSLITIRNGNRAIQDKYPKVYAEKLLYMKEGQYSPNHFHWYKTEDIINRGGGNVLIRVYNSLPDESIDKVSDVTVHCDGKAYTVPAGTQIRLTPGESIHIPQYLYHDFNVEPGSGPSCSARSVSATTTIPTTASTRRSAVSRRSRRTSRPTDFSATNTRLPKTDPSASPENNPGDVQRTPPVFIVNRKTASFSQTLNGQQVSASQNTKCTSWKYTSFRHKISIEFITYGGPQNETIPGAARGASFPGAFFPAAAEGADAGSYGRAASHFQSCIQRSGTRKIHRFCPDPDVSLFHAGCGSAGRSGPAVYETCSGAGGDGCSMNAVTDIVEVYDLLYRLGFSATNTAFFHLSYAVYLAALNPHWLVKPSQRLYPEVADQYNANPLQVVRSIDGFACASWHKNAVLLRSLTYRPLTAAPTSTQFLRILVHYIRRRS